MLLVLQDPVAYLRVFQRRDLDANVVLALSIFALDMETNLKQERNTAKIQGFFLEKSCFFTLFLNFKSVLVPTESGDDPTL